MDKNELIASVAKKVNVDVETAQKVVNAVLIEAVSPEIIFRPGQSVAFMDTNACRIPASMMEMDQSQFRKVSSVEKTTGLTSKLQKPAKVTRVIVKGIEYKE